MYDDEGRHVIAHAGGHWGFFAKVEILPDLKLGVVIMTNCNYPQGDLGPDKALTKIIYEKFVPILERKNTETAVDPRAVDLHAYAGQYALPGEYAHAEVNVRNDTVYFSLTEKPQFHEIIQAADVHQFYFAADPGKHPMLRFDTDESGKVVSLEFLDFHFKKK
jgi:hypothetical protein